MTPKPTHTQLEIDLINEARGRLKRWASDTFVRLNAADLEEDTKRLMMISLALEILFVSLPSGLTKKEFLELMEVMFDHSPKFGRKGPRA